MELPEWTPVMVLFEMEPVRSPELAYGAIPAAK